MSLQQFERGQSRGLPAPRRYYAAVAAVMDLSTEFKIDLVDAEACPPTLREAIESEGVEP